MIKLREVELDNVIGGFSISGAVINAIRSFGNALYKWGYSLGSAARRIFTNSYC